MELCMHSPLAVHCLLASAVRRSYGLQRSSPPSVRQREPSQHLKVVWIGLSSSPLIPERAVVFQLLSDLDGLGLCLQICYRGKPLKFWAPLFIAQSPVLYESRGPVELNMDWVLAELLCYRDGVQASHSVWDLGWLPIETRLLQKYPRLRTVRTPVSIPREESVLYIHVLSTSWKSGLGGF